MTDHSNYKGNAIEISLPRPSILIVDDDEQFLQAARGFFSTRGYDVDIARSPEDAIEILKRRSEHKYQVVAVDINFDNLESRGDNFVLQNLSLFDKAKKVIFTGAGWSPNTNLDELQKSGVSILEKSPNLIGTLDLMTQEESRRRAKELATVVAEQAPRIEAVTGQKVTVQIVNTTSPISGSGLSGLITDKFKRTFVKWLKARSDSDQPILYYGDKIYTAKELAEELGSENDVGLAHIQMLFNEFEESLDIESHD